MSSMSINTQYFDGMWCTMDSVDNDIIMQAFRTNIDEVMISSNRKVNIIQMTQEAQSGAVRPLRLFVSNPPTTLDTYVFEDDGAYYESDFLSLEIVGRFAAGSTSQTFVVHDAVGVPYEIDLQTNQQKNLLSGNIRKIIKINNSSNASASTAEEPEDDLPTKDEEDVPDDLRCPITSLPFKNPVIAPDGHTYERDALKRWLKKKYTSPLHGIAMPAGEIKPDVSASMALSKFRLMRK